MKTPSYIKKNAFTSSAHNGWIYGSFMPAGLEKDNRAEIKVATHPQGHSNEYHTQKTATKIDIIWQGDAIWEINGEEIQLTSGDYVIIPPGQKTRIKEVLSEQLIVQTIKLPSDPEDKVTSQGIELDSQDESA